MGSITSYIILLALCLFVVGPPLSRFTIFVMDNYGLGIKTISILTFTGFFLSALISILYFSIIGWPMIDG